jgi:hypothetical protein
VRDLVSSANRFIATELTICSTDIEEGGSTDDDTAMGGSTAEGSTGRISADLEDLQGQLDPPSWTWRRSSQHKVEEPQMLVAPKLGKLPSSEFHDLGTTATTTTKKARKVGV